MQTYFSWSGCYLRARFRMSRPAAISETMTFERSCCCAPRHDEPTKTKRKLGKEHSHCITFGRPPWNPSNCIDPNAHPKELPGHRQDWRQILGFNPSGSPKSKLNSLPFPSYHKNIKVNKKISNSEMPIAGIPSEKANSSVSQCLNWIM